jgi:dipeptidyl aminopeptidase/acylaminoacyl peptidase
MRELWTHRGSAAGFYPQAWPLEGDSFVTVTDSYEQYPEIVLVRDGKSRALTALAHEGTAYLRSIAGRMEEISWTARDGLEIQGLLLTPSGTAPYPLIVSVHGGPVSSVRSRWVGPGTIAFLVSRGYAFLFPNPRGSTGRGQEFARQVYGDLGGSETGDTLSGIDALVKRGIADPKRIGVTGGSHGGFMSSWLITQSDRFAAAVPMHPVTDFYSQHTTSNIGRFDDLFLQEEWDQPGNRHYQRSPVMHAHRVSTPTLNIAGQIDRCTPPGQAQEFHGALLEHGVESALVTYPGEGHGVRKLPAVIDVATRVVDWFQRHMPA